MIRCETPNQARADQIRPAVPHMQGHRLVSGKLLLALQLQDAVDEVQITKSELAGRLQTSRSQVDRLLDPDNTAVTLDSLERLARAVGKQLIVRLA